MAAIKTATMTVRIDPAVKEGLRVMALRERRSLANMVEVMIRDYCGRNGITISEQQTLFEDGCER
jgi:predicted HicB family RNase H-like nuclease